MERRARVVVVGDAGIDVVARHDGPIMHGADVRAKVTITVGGAGANTAAWLANRGADATLVARVGDDLAGEQVRGELSAAGVRCALAVDPEAATCCVAVLVDGSGQRSMLSDRGANARLRGTDLEASLLDGARHLHLSGYVLLDESSKQAGIAVLSAARAAGLTTSVDPQSSGPVPDPAAMVELLRGTDVLLPNADELAMLTGSTDPASARALLDVVGVIAVTAGADGATWLGRDGVAVSVPAEPATPFVDSTGAGDAFNAGLLAAWLAGSPPRVALLAGVRAGALATTRVGAQPSIT
jgi:sugar/nucleoside kinase (ribokinase family)